MKKNEIILEIFGEINRLDQYEKNNSYKEIDILNDKSNIIIKDTEREIKRVFGNYLEDLEIRLVFSEGCILITGIAVLKILGAIGGTINLINIISHSIKRILKGKIEHSLNNPRDFNIQINVNANTNNNLQNNNWTQTNLFQSLEGKILFYLTIINIIFITGGTIFGSIEIQGIQDKMRESNEKFYQANDKYLEAQSELAKAKVNYTLSIYEFESIKNQLIKKKDSILNDIKLKNDDFKNLIKGDSIRLNNSINSFRDIELKTEKITAKLDQIEKLIENNELKVSFNDVWNSMTPFLRIIFILILTTSSLSIIFYINLIRNKNIIK
jgi:hypothetical protein